MAKFNVIGVVSPRKSNASFKKRTVFDGDIIAKNRANARSKALRIIKRKAPFLSGKDITWTIGKL